MTAGWEKGLSAFIAIICPDLSSFDLVEPAIRGDVIGSAALLSVTGLAAPYIVGYTNVAYLFFVEKEL